ncbi:MAG TPA: TMEM175 family protein [Actinomycetes bacterium]|nr:TMEM175 family protein [Actinomycetes bacterium]
MADEREVAVGRAQEGDAPATALLERKHDPSRVLALSDGVFAIIITLLVLDVHVPELTEGQSLAAALREIRPSFAAFVISFIVAGMYWVGHRDLFGLIRRTDRGLVWLNILYLLPVCLLPFGASLLGRFDREPVAVRIYGLVLVAIAGMRVAIWLYATSRPHLLWQRLDDRQRRAGLGLAVFPGLVYLLAMLVASVAPAVSLVIYGGMPVLYVLSITVLRSGRKRNQEYADFTEPALAGSVPRRVSRRPP